MSATRKIDFKQELRELYAPAAEPSIVEVPDMAFLMLDGHGDPNTAPAFAAAVEALYKVAYGAKFAVKRAAEGIDFAVMPLEGLFWAPDMASFTTGDRAAWEWTLMLMQPEPVTPEVVAAAREAAMRKGSAEAVQHVRLERFCEGLAAQILHIGPYAAEGPTIRRLHDFIAEQGFRRAGKHHEIYLGDPRRTRPERLRTVIRQPMWADAESSPARA